MKQTSSSVAYFPPCTASSNCFSSLLNVSHAKVLDVTNCDTFPNVSTLFIVAEQEPNKMLIRNGIIKYDVRDSFIFDYLEIKRKKFINKSNKHKSKSH